MTSTTGASRRYGTTALPTRRRVRRRRDSPGAVAAADPSAPGKCLGAVEGLRDVVAGNGCCLLDRKPPGQDLRQHRLEDVAVLDVDPVLRLRYEPAAGSRTLVDARAEQARRVRDVALGLQRLLALRAREVG